MPSTPSIVQPFPRIPSTLFQSCLEKKNHLGILVSEEPFCQGAVELIHSALSTMSFFSPGLTSTPRAANTLDKELMILDPLGEAWRPTFVDAG